MSGSVPKVPCMKKAVASSTSTGPETSGSTNCVGKPTSGDFLESRIFYVPVHLLIQFLLVIVPTQNNERDACLNCDRFGCFGKSHLVRPDLKPVVFDRDDKILLSLLLNLLLLL